MDLGITGRIALVTGAGRGIGRAIALRLASEGVRVGLLGRTPERLDETRSQIETERGEAMTLVADLADPTSLDAAVKQLEERWGTASVLVHNAAQFSPRVRLERAEWDEAIAANLKGVTHLTNRVLGGMRRERWGRIILVSSLMAMGGGRGYAVYSTLKAAQEGLVRAIALDYGPFGITANAVAPGFIATEHFYETAPAELQASHAEAAAVKRLGTPEEVASTVAFLASETSSFISGSTLAVGGGAHLNTRW